MALALAMVFTLLPVTALAAEEEPSSPTTTLAVSSGSSAAEPTSEPTAEPLPDDAAPLGEKGGNVATVENVTRSSDCDADQVGIYSLSAYASGGWADNAATSYASGSGTAADPWIINTAQQLAYLSKQATGTTYSGKYFKLGANIDLSAHYWTPIGHDDHPFKSTFDGAGYTIYGMNVVDGYRSNLDGKWLNAGFFGTADDATIKNVNIVGATIDVTQTYNQTMHVGGIGGYICNSGVTDCSFNGTIIARYSNAVIPSTSNIYVGGIVGRTHINIGSYGSNFTNCSAFGSITTESASVYECLMGGIAGETSWGGDGDATMTNCYANSTLTNNASCRNKLYFGGVVGYANMRAQSSLMYYRYPEEAGKGFGTIKSSLSQSTATYLNSDEAMKTTMISGLPGWNCSNDVNNGYPIPVALYDVTYELGGGSGATTGKAAFGYPLALPEPIKAGYSFTGWYTAAAGGTRYDAGYIHLLSGETTLYAHWECSGHVYDNDCDTTCNICSAIRSITHAAVTDAAVAPTCTMTGKTEGSHCSVCGEVIVAQETIAAKGHSMVLDKAVAATCTATGLTSGFHCSRCDGATTAQEEVAALGHGMVTDAAVPATCTATGLTAGSHCSRCDAATTAQREVAALGHDMVTDAAVAPTCTATGKTAGSHCSRCDGATTAQREVAALGHDMVEDAAAAPTCTEAGKTEGSHCSRCDGATTAQEAIAALGHGMVTDAAVPATCTATGLTAGSHCSRCDAATTAQREVAALGHDMVEDAAAAPTCTEAGKTEGSHCSRCDGATTPQEEVAALGHDMVVDAAVAPTCTATGLTAGSHCSRCDAATTAQEEVAALGHDMVEDVAVAATCTATGKTEGSHCSRCDGATTDQEVVAALGHDMVEDAAAAPTCTEAGKTEGSHCSRCDGATTAQEEVAALGHDMVVDEAVAATCTATGLTAGSHCSRCEDATTAQREVAALGHDMVEDAAVAPTCTEAGKTEGSHCSWCDAATTAQREVAALGHDMTKHVAKSATAAAEGNIDYWYCSRCEKYFGDAAGSTEIAREVTVVYHIGYDLQGGEVNPANPTNYTVETEDITLSNPIRTGYTFAGWTGSNGTAAQTNVAIARGSTGQKTYTATWTVNRYPITYQITGEFFADDAYEVVEGVAFDTKLAAIDDDMARPGYTFSGWSGLPATMPDGSVTVIGSYDVNRYTVAYNANKPTDASVDAQGIPANADCTYDTVFAIGAAPTLTGYTFQGWNTKADGKGTSYAAEQADANNLTTENNATVTLYAMWKSTDTSVTEVAVNETVGTISGTTIIAVLPYGTAIPTDSTKVSIIPATGTVVSDLATVDRGKTWTFTVTAEDGMTKRNYAIKVSVAPDPAAGSKADVAAAKSVIEGRGWTVAQNIANTEETIKAWIESQLAGMNLNGVGYTINMAGLTAAAAGTYGNRDGTNGSFSFTVSITKGVGDTLATDMATVTNGSIIATAYSIYIKPLPSAQEQAAASRQIAPNPFADVRENDWFFGDVMFVYENKLMLGTSASTFSPDDAATRALVATILWRMEGSPGATGTGGFIDVLEGTWYTDAITWAKRVDIVRGYSETTFGPNSPITREQLAVFFYRYAALKGYDLTITESLNKFTDKDSVSAWAVDAMRWAVGHGVIQGEPGNLLDPQGDATRAQLAAMLHRFIEKNNLVESVTETGLMGWTDQKGLNAPLNTPDTENAAGNAWHFVMFAIIFGCVVLLLANRRKGGARGGNAKK